LVPPTTVVAFREADGSAPVVAWLEQLRSTAPRAFAKCLVRLERLSALGHDLRRPEADTVRNGIHELRIRFGRVNYRILYAFSSPGIAVLLHALTKEADLPNHAIDLAVARRQEFDRNHGAHGYVWLKPSP
jgi:phage-related protein